MDLGFRRAKHAEPWDQFDFTDYARILCQLHNNPMSFDTDQLHTARCIRINKSDNKYMLRLGILYLALGMQSHKAEADEAKSAIAGLTQQFQKKPWRPSNYIKQCIDKVVTITQCLNKLLAELPNYHEQTHEQRIFANTCYRALESVALETKKALRENLYIKAAFSLGLFKTSKENATQLSAHIDQLRDSYMKKAVEPLAAAGAGSSQSTGTLAPKSGGTLHV